MIVFGEAYLVESGPEFERDRNLLYEKFPQYERVAPIEAGTTAIIEFRIDLRAQQRRRSALSGCVRRSRAPTACA